MALVTCEQKGQVAILTINRPEALNALNEAVFKDLDAVLTQVEKDVKADKTRAVIITGSGEKSFVAGADIGVMEPMTKKQGQDWGKYGNDMMLKVENFPVPVIAAVNGFALGGGCELSLSCDIRLCSANARFGQPEAGLGITPGFGGTQRLARTINVGKAKEILYSTNNIKAEEAKAIGLVNEVYPDKAALMEAAEKLAGKIAAQAPIAVRAIKRAVNEGLQVGIKEAVAIEEKEFGGCFETEDQKMAMHAFVSKSKDPKVFKNK
jgi:enoyl-CoA hydratase